MESRIDFDNWKGKKVKIADVKIEKIKTRYYPSGAYFAKVFTEKLTEIDGKPITASRFLPMTSENTWKPLGDLQQILDFYSIESPKELIGKDVEIVVTNKGNNKKWLEWNPTVS